MCQSDNSTATEPMRRSSSLLLLTHDSFVIDGPNKDDANKRLRRKDPHSLGGPSLASTLITVAFYVAVLFVVEALTFAGIARIAHLYPVLEDERSQHILARHLGVDFFAIVICAYVAYANRHVCSEIVAHAMSRGKSDFMGADGFEERVFGYHPGAQRLMVLFFVYQVKNMYDTIYWNDGIVFVIHHICAGFAAWGGMFPGYCHFYSLFYFGFSEVSTAILCLLANFDPEFGVVGLDEVFPKTKFILGALFVISFLVCRIVLWPFVTYYYFQDVNKAIRSDSPLLEGRRGYLIATNCMCTCLSLIQFVFVAMIVQTGKEELAKLMVLLEGQ